LHPFYQPGDILILSPKAPLRSGDRVFLRLAEREIRVGCFVRRTGSRVDLRPASGHGTELSFDGETVAGLARILWVSQ
jgi:phage repressor protein C with HTH and peptisase S24 domain